jgi:hypothetical protein
MPPVTLPDFPKGKEFEEFVSAHFQSGGLYIERNIIERNAEEVLELDIITTDYDKNPPEIKLHEIKSGYWGFPDIFKLNGWINYLKIRNALLVVNSQKDNIAFINEKANSLSIDIVIIENLEETASILYDYYPGGEINPLDVAIWRFSYWVERNLLRYLKNQKKSQREKRSYPILDQYYHEVNSSIFFTENIIERVGKLYNEFREHPHISAQCANESIGGSYDDECRIIPAKVFSETYYACTLTDIQISTFIEHRARLALLKSAVDYKLYEIAGIKEKTESYINILGFKISKLDFLPVSFVRGLEQISKHKYFHRYPVFWQWFLWFFGGFILLDYEEQEYNFLSQKTGIPVDEIPNAFSAYDLLFPIDIGWFLELPRSNIRSIRLFSVPFMGVGANLRRFLYTEKASYMDLKLTREHTFDNLIKWNNLTAKLLRQ